MNLEDGIKRLSLASAGTVAFLVFVGGASFRYGSFIEVLVLSLFWGGIAFVLVRIAGWVIAGFRGRDE